MTEFYEIDTSPIAEALAEIGITSGHSIAIDETGITVWYAGTSAKGVDVAEAAAAIRARAPA